MKTQVWAVVGLTIASATATYAGANEPEQRRAVESPVLKSVEFQGRKHVSLKDVQDAMGLKPGTQADAERIRIGLNRLGCLYADRGFDLSEVKLVEGGVAGDDRVVIQVFEGPRHPPLKRIR